MKDLSYKLTKVDTSRGAPMGRANSRREAAQLLGLTNKELLRRA